MSEEKVAYLVLASLGVTLILIKGLIIHDWIIHERDIEECVSLGAPRYACRAFVNDGVPLKGACP